MFDGGMWDLIVFVPDHSLFLYLKCIHIPGESCLFCYLLVSDLMNKVRCFNRWTAIE